MYEKIKLILISAYGNYNALQSIWEVVRPKKRSLSQNALYWLILAFLERETNQYTKEQWHYLFRINYLPRTDYLDLFNHYAVDLIKIKANEWQFIPSMIVASDVLSYSTTELSKSDFTKYLEKIRYFAGTELDINLPDPSDLNINQIYEFYKEVI